MVSNTINSYHQSESNLKNEFDLALNRTLFMSMMAQWRLLVDEFGNEITPEIRYEQ